MHQRPAQERHQERLARPLRVPDHPAAPVALTGRQNRRHALPDRVELVVARDLLDGPLALVLEDHEAAQHREQGLGREQPLDHRLDGERRGLLDQRLAIHGPPEHVSVEIGGDRTVARRDPVGDHRQQVRAEQLRHIRFVGLDLVEGRRQVGSLGAFELHHDERKPVQEKHHVRQARGLADDLKLVDREPVVPDVLRIDEPRPRAHRRAFHPMLDGDATDEHLVDVAGSRRSGRPKARRRSPS